jgi:hypothetical protein
MLTSFLDFERGPTSLLYYIQAISGNVGGMHLVCMLVAFTILGISGDWRLAVQTVVI